MDPNVVFAPQVHEHRIYGDDRGHLYAVVDEDDWHELKRWRWSPLFRRRKIYLRRTIGRTGISEYLHIAILERAQLVPPTPAHKLVDHRDGNSLNCLRSNLRWATVEMNNRNRFGLAVRQGAFA